MPTYAELLQSPEWLEKRTQIIKRDLNRCQSCYNERTVPFFSAGVLDTGGLIRVLGKSAMLFFRGSKEVKEELTAKAPLFLVFQENDSWVNIIGYRKLTKREYDAYIVPVQAGLDALLSGKGRFDIQNLFQSFEIQEQVDVDFSKLLWDEFKSLHVHHTFYQKGKMPWEYPVESLKTLCWVCHEQLHKDVKVPVLDEFGNQFQFYTPCKKCYGAGVFPEYSHVQGGVCFRCNGNCYEELRTKN